MGILASLFKINFSTFQRMVTFFVENYGSYAYEHLVTKKTDYLLMKRLHDKNNRFLLYSEALYVTDVICQQSFRPCRTMEGSKLYFSCKRHLCGLRTEISVLPIGLAIGHSTTYPGAFADISIFRANKKWHDEQLRMFDDEDNVADHGDLSDEYMDSCAVLMDNDYTGAHDSVCAIIPMNKPTNEWLSTSHHEQI